MGVLNDNASCCTCPSTSSLTVEKLASIPASIQAQIFVLGGNRGAASFGTTCKLLQKEVWNSVEVWEAMIVPPQPHGRLDLPPECSAEFLADILRAEHRWRSYGIDTFLSWRTHLPKPVDHVQVLLAARRALRGVVSGRHGDKPNHVDGIAGTLVDLLQWYDPTNGTAHEVARQLIQEAKERSDIFLKGHLRELTRAWDNAVVLREDLQVGLALVSEGDAFPVLFGEHGLEDDSSLAESFEFKPSHDTESDCAVMPEIAKYCVMVENDNEMDRMFNVLQAMLATA